MTIHEFETTIADTLSLTFEFEIKKVIDDISHPDGPSREVTKLRAEIQPVKMGDVTLSRENLCDWVGAQWVKEAEFEAADDYAEGV